MRTYIKNITIIIISFVLTSCNNHLEFSLRATPDGIEYEKKDAQLYIQVDNCKNEDLYKGIQNGIFNIIKKECYKTSDGIKTEFSVPLEITNNWRNTDTISVISNNNTFLTIKIPYKAKRLFNDRVNYYSGKYPIYNEYPIINIDLTLGGNKNVKLLANSIYFNSSPIAHGMVTLKKGETVRITLATIAVEQLFKSGQVTILSHP